MTHAQRIHRNIEIALMLLIVVPCFIAIGIGIGSLFLYNVR